MSGGACPACTGTWPDALQRVADLGRTVVYLHDDQFFPGWTVLVLKRHAVELFELSAEERAVLTEDVSTVAATLAGAFEARKINYALLGNQLPHIHWHVIPRGPRDPAPRESPWSVPHTPVRLTSAERDRRIASIRARLSA